MCQQSEHLCRKIFTMCRMCTIYNISYYNLSFKSSHNVINFDKYPQSMFNYSFSMCDVFLKCFILLET